MQKRSWIGFLCLMFASINALAKSEKEIWQDAGLTPQTARLIFADQRCSTTPEIAKGCLQALRTILQKYKPTYMWTASFLKPTKVVRSFDIIHISEPEHAISQEDTETSINALNAFAQSKYQFVHNVFTQIFDWIFDEVVPVDEAPYATAILLNTYYSIANDAYTRIEPKEEFEKSISTQPDDYVGIGVILDATRSKILVQYLLPDSPSAIAGLRIGDEIVQVDDLTLDEHGQERLLDSMPGEENSKVTIGFIRNGLSKTITVTRQKLAPKYVSSSTLLGHKGRITLINVSSFHHRFVCKDVRKEILNNQDSTAYILDLRNNGGGLLNEAICMAGLFIESNKKLLSYLPLNPNQKQRPPSFNQNKPITAKPIAILQNEMSASASEILSVIIQDYRRGAIIGKPSFGKGITQSISSWSNFESATRNDFGLADIHFFYTSEYFESPLNRLIHHKGVEPDFATGERNITLLKEASVPGSPKLPVDYRSPSIPQFNKELLDCMARSGPNTLARSYEDSDLDILKAKHYFWCKDYTKS